MFKNIKLKRAIKKCISPVLSRINEILPKDDNTILLYSANGGIEHNLIPIKRYLLENDYDTKYKIYCGVENINLCDNDSDRVKYINRAQSVLIFLFCKHVYYTTGQIPVKPSRNQIVIHLDHGTATIKANNLMSNINNGDDFFFTYYTVPGDVYIPIAMKEFNCNKSNVVINGEPVNDDLLNRRVTYNLGNYSKIGLWAPTFRQSDYLGYDDSEEGLLPAFDENDYEELNENLKTHNFMLIVKLHPCQNVDNKEILHFSNLNIYSHKEFVEHGYDLYSLLSQVDFLLGDYSSVSLQYLLLDRPQAFVIPDIDEYKQKRGFAFDDPLEYMPGVKVFNKNDLYNFFDELDSNVDRFAEERKRVKNIIYKYQDSNNCKRALELGNITYNKSKV